MKIDIEFNTAYGMFRDALYLPDDQPMPSDDEIEAMKLERLNNWLAIVTPQVPTEPVEPLPEEG